MIRFPLIRAGSLKAYLRDNERHKAEELEEERLAAQAALPDKSTAKKDKVTGIYVL